MKRNHIHLGPGQIELTLTDWGSAFNQAAAQKTHSCPYNSQIQNPSKEEFQKIKFILSLQSTFVHAQYMQILMTKLKILVFSYDTIL